MRQTTPHTTYSDQMPWGFCFMHFPASPRRTHSLSGAFPILWGKSTAELDQFQDQDQDDDDTQKRSET